mmetsp:Transcript_46592/g.111694  ORF Transcript_46592/g.111694 Transcript_46592/m.111694 type:complete len:390 (-) Transcript_46592:302-1471(-)
MAVKLERSLQMVQSQLLHVKATVKDLRQMVQSMETGARRQEEPPLARTEEPESPCSRRSDRVARLARLLASPAVQERALEEVPMQLSLPEVAKLFLDHVPRVQRFVCQGQAGRYSLKLIQSAYTKGFASLAGTGPQRRLLWLLRLIIHHCHSQGPGSAGCLQEVAEAFTGDEAVQAAAVERVGLQVKQAALDFRGHLVKLVDEYKSMAVRDLAAEDCAKLKRSGSNCGIEHCSKQILRDFGEVLGLNQEEVESARLDDDSQARFPQLTENERTQFMARFGSFFNVEAVLGAFVTEVKKPEARSSDTSLASVFFKWAAERLSPRYALQQIEAYVCSGMDDVLALAVFEAVFFGQPAFSIDEANCEDWFRDLLCPAAAVEFAGTNAKDELP